MYSKKKMEEALKVYHTTKSVGKTVQKLGYPTSRQLYSWINNEGNVPVEGVKISVSMENDFS